MEVEKLTQDVEYLSDATLLEEMRGEEGDRPIGALEPFGEEIP